MNDVSRLHCGVMDQYSHRYFCSADQSSVKNSTRTTQFPLQMRFWPEFTQQVATKWLITCVFWSLLTDDVIICFYVIAIINQSIVYSKG